MDCLTEMLKHTLDAMTGRQGEVLTTAELHQFGQEALMVSHKEREVFVPQMGRILAERDGYANSPAWYTNMLWEALRIAQARRLLAKDKSQGGDL